MNNDPITPSSIDGLHPWLSGPLGAALLVAALFLTLCYVLAPYYIYRTFIEIRRIRKTVDSVAKISRDRQR